MLLRQNLLHQIPIYEELFFQACEIYTGVEKIIVIGMDDIPEDCASFLNMMIYDDGTLYDQVPARSIP